MQILYQCELAATGSGTRIWAALWTTLWENIGKVPVWVLQKHGVQDRLFALTTDNALNNSTASKFVREHCKHHTKGRHIPCLAHVLQLSLGALLSNVRAAPSNDCEIEMWHNNMALSVYAQYGVSALLEKVSCCLRFAVVLGKIIWPFAALVIYTLKQCEFTAKR
jgi:hypothetical protein